jgi:hypothetical protein
MFNRSRKNKLNNAPVNEPDKKSGFLCFLFLKIGSILERAGAPHKKERRITKPPYMYFFNKQFLFIFLITFISSCNPAFAEPIKLTASFYSLSSLKKEGTYAYSKGIQANGKIFDENALTCASCDFPLKTKLRVTMVKDTKKSVIVEVSDRTNKRFKGKRIDLSKRAFMEIASCEQGIVSVLVEVLP